MEERTYLSGTSLAGMSPTRSRVENDYYATPFEATEAILSREELHGSILEPAAGEGHISKVLREHYPNSQIISTDLVQRDDRFGCGIDQHHEWRNSFLRRNDRTRRKGQFGNPS